MQTVMRNDLWEGGFDLLKQQRQHQLVAILADVDGFIGKMKTDARREDIPPRDEVVYPSADFPWPAMDKVPPQAMF
jgi:hypothetical protein